MTKDNCPDGSRLSEGLGPLPYPRAESGCFGLNPDLFTADQMRAYAAQEVAAERERWRNALSYAVKEADGWFDESHGGMIETPEMDAARALLRA